MADDAGEPRPEPELPVFDEAFVRGGIREPSAAERADRADRMAALERESEEARQRQTVQRRPHRRLGRNLRRWIPTVLVVSVLLGVAWVQRPQSGSSYAAGGFLLDVDDGHRPTPSPAVDDVPLGVPSPTATSDSYSFMDTQADGATPVAYDPCREIHVVINGRTVPTGAERVVHDALDEMSAITGLQFVVDGEVDEVPAADREAFLPDRYGDRWAPVLIAWSDATEVPELDGDVAGIGGSSRISVDGTKVYVSGMVALDGPSFDTFMSYPNGSELARAVVLHELAHVVGLEHVDDAQQLMYHDNVGRLVPQAGDRAGLVRLGQGACFPEL